MLVVIYDAGLRNLILDGTELAGHERIVDSSSCRTPCANKEP